MVSSGQGSLTKVCEIVSRKEQNDDNTVDHTRRYGTNRPPTSLHNKPLTLMEFQDIFIVFNRGCIKTRVCSGHGSLAKECKVYYKAVKLLPEKSKMMKTQWTTCVAMTPTGRLRCCIINQSHLWNFKIYSF